jgi:hypothetical protein
MQPVITIADTTVRDSIHIRLIYDPVYSVWSVYHGDQEIWQNDDGVATYEIYLATLEEALTNVR